MTSQQPQGVFQLYIPHLAPWHVCHTATPQSYVLWSLLCLYLWKPFLASEDPGLVHLRLPVANLDDHLLARLVPHHRCIPYTLQLEASATRLVDSVSLPGWLAA